MVLAYSLDQEEADSEYIFHFLYLARFRRSSRRKVREKPRNNNNKKKKKPGKKKKSGNLMKRTQKNFERDPEKNFFASETLWLSESKKSRTEVRDLTSLQ